MHHTSKQCRFSLLKFALSVGDTVTFGAQQIYTLTEISRTENDKELFTWSTHCPVCGDTFTQYTGRLVGGITRRCKLHATKGKRVAPVQKPMGIKEALRREHLRLSTLHKRPDGFPDGDVINAKLKEYKRNWLKSIDSVI